MADHARTELATSPFDAPLEVAARRARDWVRGLPDRPVGARAGLADLRAALDVPLTDEGADPATVVRELADASEPGLVATGSPRYFGFVIGGALPAALAADWLASAWDQNAGLHVGGPAAAVVEEIAGRWVLDLLGLPAGASFGFVTGCQMAHVTALAAARNDVLARAGWDVERQGLVGAPPVRVLAGEARHATLDRALRLLGLGTDAVEPVACGPDGRVRLDALAERLGRPGAAGPTIVCAQVGEVNTGAVDPVAEICDLAHDHGAWVHVDGAFGLWAAASPALRPLVAGVERADSWATDFHKWLNVPYDSGFAACAHPASHRAAMGTRADYLVHAEPDGPRDQMDWNPEFSRRARGFAVYAALRSLGRRGVADLVERCCALARRAAGALARLDGVEVLNDVVLDQVLVGFRDVDAGRVVEEVQRSGECWMSGTTWQGRPAMRISVINWQTGEDDVDRAVAAIEAAVASLTRVSPNRSEP
ncbi:MAG: aminotransferase class V-fold PLP-dependent enzyme [Thermoanaerobacterales bacterium]|nr:aspartate aminotransferase family protein [Thermoanaerobacterales bacterium]